MPIVTCRSCCANMDGKGTLDGRNRSSGFFAGAFPQGSMGRERPPQGVLRKCELRNSPVPDPGTKKGGAPVHLRFPRAALRTRDYAAVTDGKEKRSGKSSL